MSFEIPGAATAYWYSPDGAPDIDGDGWPDVEELEKGTDPLDRLSFPLR